MFMLLRNRNFALFWVAGVVNALGDYILIAALPFYVYIASGSTLFTGLLFMVQMLPPMVLGSLAGVYVDRWNKRRTLIMADMILALVLLPLLAVHVGTSTWIAVVVALLEAAAFQFVPPAAGSLLRRVVEGDHLARANAIRSTGFNAAVLIGPSLGALLVSRLGLTAVVLADAASYALAGSAIVFMKVPPATQSRTNAEGEADRRFWAEWLSGLQSVRSQSWLRVLFTVEGVAMVGAGMVWVLLLVFIKGTLRAGAVEYGWWLSLNAVGGLAGSGILGYLAARVPPHRLVAAGACGDGLTLLLLAQLGSVPVMLLLAPFTAITAVTWTVSAGTMLQLGVSQDYLGRVLGAYGALGSLSVLFGLGIASLLGGRIDTVSLLSTASALYLLAGLVAAAMPRPPAAAAERDSFP